MTKLGFSWRTRGPSVIGFYDYDFLALNMTSLANAMNTKTIACVKLRCRMTPMEHAADLVDDASGVISVLNGSFLHGHARTVTNLGPSSGTCCRTVLETNFMMGASGGYISC